jgi:integrase
MGHAELLRETLRLHLADGVGALTFRRLVEAFGSPREVLKAPRSALRRVQGVGEKTCRAIEAVPEEMIDAELAEADARGARILLPADAEYPAALRRDGVIDARKDRFSEENRKPLAEHVADYVAHCQHAGHAGKHIAEKRRNLGRMLDGTGATRLSELTADVLEGHLRTLRDRGLSARTVNFARQIAVAFVNWCKQTGRAEANPLAVVAKLDERKDRRRMRRPLTDDELARLLAVAEPAGRKAWYMAAALAGLRKGDLRRLTWGDVDFDAGTITIRDGKAKRTDVIPLHAQLAGELKRRLAEHPALPTARVFPETVTDQTRLRDFLGARLARREVVTDANGQPVMIGKGKWRRPKTRIVTEDEQGRVIDLHAMRTTLGTNLARAGVAPQIAQQIMRHSDYRTTQKHYTVLGVTDTAKAMERVPRIDRPQREAATGTMDTRPQQRAQQFPRQLGRETGQSGAKRRTDSDGGHANGGVRQALQRPKESGTLRPNATSRSEAGEEIRTPDVQLGKLAFCH